MTNQLPLFRLFQDSFYITCIIFNSSLSKIPSLHAHSHRQHTLYILQIHIIIVTLLHIVQSVPNHMESPNLISLLKHTFKKKSKTGAAGGGGLLRMFKLLPMLTTGCKMAALLTGHRKPLLSDWATTGTLFGYRKGRLILAIQENPHRPPIFVIELPILTSLLQKEMASDVLRIAFEADTKTHRKQILEEFVWAVYCNGRKIGYSIRRKNMTDDEAHVMQLLRGVSMGAGVLPSSSSDKLESADWEMTYIRARFDRVVGSKDCESFYMINPDGASSQELSIFFLRVVR